MLSTTHSRPTKLKTNFHQVGFTLVELIIVIIIGGIVAAMTTSILTLPIQAYMDSTRRATLTDVAESSLRRMSRDIHRALPNSIRITNGGKTLELLHLVDGGRYRAKQDNNDPLPSDTLDFTIVDSSADIIGRLKNFANITTNQNQLVIYPVNVNDAYSGINTATLATGTTNTSIRFNAKQFPLASPQHRFFIIDNAITYHCDLVPAANNEKTLMRYEGYAIQANQVTPPAAPLNTDGAIQANYLSDCNFNYDSGSSTRSGLVTLELTFTDESGESVRLLQQVHLDNQP